MALKPNVKAPVEYRKKIKKNVDVDPIDIIAVLDRSGSMWNLLSDTIEGVNAFLGGQKALTEDDSTVKVYLFDSMSEVRINKIRDSLLSDWKPITASDFRPDGWTPLLDAVGKVLSENINRIDESRKKLFLIMTDGYENSSREYTTSKLKTLITKARSKGWQFVFLGADVDTWGLGQSIGLPRYSSFGAQGQSLGAFYTTNMTMSTNTYRGSSVGVRNATLDLNVGDAEDELSVDKTA